MTTPPLGAELLPDGSCSFLVWAPRRGRVELHLLGPDERIERLTRDADGFHAAVVEGVRPGRRYLFRLDGSRERPDPASRLQPEGVHGPSEVVDGAFAWTDRGWGGVERRRLVFYEVHVGVFGGLDALIAHLDGLAELGVTALQLMPLAQFPGTRNWGYDGAFPFAVQASYGGPLALKRLVDAAHRRGLAIFLDAVYNHLAPEGCVLEEYGPYASERCRTPWGKAVNFDGPGSDEVRRFFVENALRWVREFHVDGLRLDAVHAIVDLTARPFLAELADAVHAEAARLDRPVHLVAESNLNDPRVVTPGERGGLGLDAQWNDDFHHALHACLTGERSAHHADFGGARELAKAIGEGYVLTGQRSAYRGRRHGVSSAHVEPDRFVVFAQNHDRVGNRPGAERLASLVDLARLKLAAFAVTLSPGLPLLFMGEEDGETAPFPYFIDHADPTLVERVRAGRRALLARAGAAGQGFDPQDPATFLAARPRRAPEGPARLLRPLFRELLRLRRETPALAIPAPAAVHVADDTVVVERAAGSDRALLLLRCSATAGRADLPPGRWRIALDTASTAWAGPGAPPVLPEGPVDLLAWQALLLLPE